MSSEFLFLKCGENRTSLAILQEEESTESKTNPDHKDVTTDIRYLSSIEKKGDFPNQRYFQITDL